MTPEQKARVTEEMVSLSKWVDQRVSEGVPHETCFAAIVTTAKAIATTAKAIVDRQGAGR
jgi:hypothetical protein